MDLRRRQAGGRGYGRGTVRAGSCAVVVGLVAAFLGAAGTAGAATAGARAGPAAAGPARGAAPGGWQVAKICAEPSSGAVLTTAARAAAAGAPAAAIRVDQVGYPSGAAKLAEIMTKARPSGGLRWVVVRAGSCTVAASGVARQDLGPWSKRYGWVWAARFSGVRAPGRYRVGILGDASAASPWFTIGPAAQLYARPLANALYFYENERDGPDFIHTALRSAPGHLSDLSAMTYRSPPVDENGNFRGSLAKYATGVRINASGGWFDAGDYLHFVETTSYTEATLLQGIASFPDQMGAAQAGAGAGRGSGGTDFTGEARFGLDFLQRMWDQRTRTLYYQVGTGEANSYYYGDHDIWRLPQADDKYKGTNPHYVYIRHPPVFRAGQPGAPISPNLAGLAADFALCYQVFRHSDPGYAANCLREAETVYAQAGTHWKGQLLTALPWDFYPETSWHDDMMLGATELARALQEGSASSGGRPPATPRDRSLGGERLRRTPPRQPMACPRASRSGPRPPTCGTPPAGPRLGDQQAGAVRHAQPVRRERAGRLPARPGPGPAAGGRPGHHPGPAAGQPARADPEGDPHRREGPVRLRVRLGPVGHHRARRRAGRDGRRVRRAGRPAVYAAWGQRWLDDILGSNAWGVSLIVGDGTVYPDCMQHQVANLAGSLDGRPPVLAGATVEGPNSFAATGTVPHMRLCAANAPGDVPYAAYNGQKAVFADNVQSYSTVEPAIDLTALTPLAFAWPQYVAGPAAR